MIFAFLTFAFGCVVGYVGFREYLDRGSTGIWGHPALVGVVALIAGLLMVPTMSWLFSGSPFLTMWLLAFLCLPYAPYFAAQIGYLISGAVTGEGSQPAEPPNPFYGAECAVRVGSIEPALEEYRRVLREDIDALTPQEVVAGHIRVVELLVRKDRYAEALDWLERTYTVARAVPPGKRARLPLSSIAPADGVPPLPSSAPQPRGGYTEAPLSPTPWLQHPADEMRLELLRSEALEGLGRREEALAALRELLEKQRHLPDNDQGRAAAELIPTVAARLQALMRRVEETIEPIEDVDLEQQPSEPASAADDEGVVIEPPPDFLQ